METIANEKRERTVIEGILVYIGLLLRWKWFILIVTGIGTLSVVVFCLISVVLPPAKSPLPNVYSAQAILHIQRSSQGDIAGSILQTLGINQERSASAGFDNGELVMEILRSRSIIDRLVSDLKVHERYGISDGLKGQIRQTVLSHFSFSYSRASSALVISYQDIDPVFSRDMVNRVVELLDEWYSLNRGAAKQKQKEILGEKINEVKQDIESLQNQLKSLQRRYGVLTAQDLGATQAASLANLQSQLVLKEIEIKNYSSFSKVNDPRLEQMNAERQNLLDLIDQNKTKITNSNSDNPSQSSLPDVAQQFSKLTMELDIQQRIYNTLSPQYEAAKLAPESEPIFQVFEMAEVPDMKSGPQRMQYILIGFGGSFMLSIFLVFAITFMRGLLNDPEKMKFLRAKIG